jgi:hypothetical protein
VPTPVADKVIDDIGVPSVNVNVEKSAGRVFHLIPPPPEFTFGKVTYLVCDPISSVAVIFTHQVELEASLLRLLVYLQVYI